MDFTQEQINEFKAKNPDGVFRLVSGELSCLLKRPNRALVSIMLSNGRDPLAMVDVLLENCWLAGDESLKEDVGFLYSLMGRIDDIIGKKTVELKNL